MKQIINKHTVAVLILIIFSFSCSKSLDVGPPKDKIITQQVFANDEIATSAITGVYSQMATGGFGSGSRGGISVLCALSATDLSSYNPSLDYFYYSSIPSSNYDIMTLWTNAYQYIYTANSVIENLQLSSGVSESTKKQLTGEAKFIRAFCYFYLTNLFGDVPLNLHSDYRQNINSFRSSQAIVYDQIKADLIDADSLLSESYVTGERIRPNRFTAKALLSRVYLYLGNWQLAEQLASTIIDRTDIYSLVDLDDVFLKNSNETIWQLMPTAGGNTLEGELFVLTAPPVWVSINTAFVKSFEPGDNRRIKWIGEFTDQSGQYFFPNKYKIQSSSAVKEYSMVIRLAEVYLIRAEARIKMGLLSTGLDDLNAIRKRAGLLLPLAGLDQTASTKEVEKQRHFELFTEWGHRWLDLKRTNLANTVLSSIKGSSWSNTDILYPIPDDEINRNKNMTQNIGY